MNDAIIEALNSMAVSDLSYDDWLRVGMALRNEGYPVEVWEEWSKGESRYHPGECEKKWATFDGYMGPKVKGGTIVKLAREYGRVREADSTFGWEDEIERDGDVFGSTRGVHAGCPADSTAPRNESPHRAYEETGLEGMSPVEQLKTYLTALFQPSDIVGYVTGDVWKNDEGRYLPAKGVYTRTAGELLEDLDRYPDDLGASVGDWKEACGAWIRFNPLDGKGVKNANVTAFRYALVESDNMPLDEQKNVYERLNLPVAALVYSGGKSLHAIVHIDAEDEEQYRERVNYLYGMLEKNGCIVDKQNRNPSRLSRMPGVTRNGVVQALLAVNTGCRSWQEWLSKEESADGLPEMEDMGFFLQHMPELPEELIKGVLRCGHKMLIAGASKAGKSFLLLELCIALSEGREWLGFPCRKSKVVYINLEIDPASCVRRVLKIYEALGITPEHPEDLVIWNLRGKAVPLDRLVPMLLKRIGGKGFDAIVLDPIYKVITGDENTASDMAYFTNQFDRICAETGCSVIFCHHHSKGAQGGKKSQDRASGSGVFARDPDAVLDMIELTLTDDLKNRVRDGNATAWRLECSLREFENFRPVNFWFEYPVHRVDEVNLENAYADGSALSNLSKSSRRTSADERKNNLDTAFEMCEENGRAKICDLAEYLGIAAKSIKRYAKEYEDEYSIENGLVFRKM